jgi:hypothetical protein
MYHAKIVSYASAENHTDSGLALFAFFDAHEEALGDAAARLAGRKGASLVSSILAGLRQPGPLSQRLHRLLLELRELLFLQHVHDEEREESAYFAMLDPADPIVVDICLLADGLQTAMLPVAKSGQAA